MNNLDSQVIKGAQWKEQVITGTHAILADSWCPLGTFQTCCILVIPNVATGFKNRVCLFQMKVTDITWGQIDHCFTFMFISYE